MKLSGNTILITGGTSGIGFELVKQLTALNNTVLITGRQEDRLARAKKAFPQIHTYQSDVNDPEAIAVLFKKVTQDFSSLNILINNAGIMRTMNFQDDFDDLTKLTKEIETNLSGPIRMVKKFLPHLKKQKSAAIMNVSSGLAFSPYPAAPVYCATKAGLHSFTLSLRMQLKKTSVKIFELAPPATETEMLGDLRSKSMKGLTIMKVDTMVKAAIDGLLKDQFEIRPGQSNQLRLMSRVAPDFILNQMSKPLERLFSSQGEKN